MMSFIFCLIKSRKKKSEAGKGMIVSFYTVSDNQNMDVSQHEML